MGKTNKGNRTKGNTRPSSSGHSAQLLSSSGKPLTGFIGFEALEKDIPSYVPVTGQHSSDVSDLSVDADLRMVMRKMLKRDNVTRLKAVQEFGDLCAEKDKDTVKNVLPFWPRLFNKLALDNDRRIREATHHANGKLISNVKREIAPYLKNIMGVWLLGQNDLHAPAASAAQATFTATFPKSKQSEALMHCKSEIFSYFKDNLFEQTAKSMSESNSVSPEDIENKYTLVISATLQAMKLFLVTVSPNEISNVQDDYISFVAENKFWKFAKSKEAQIRGSWYVLISYLCHVKSVIFVEMEKKLVAAVFGSLAESDPIVAPSVWESALQVVVNFSNCWQGISIHKVVLPQLWTMLNEGGRGSAHVIYPCVLPFLSKFPREVISKEAVLLQLFTCLRHSLTLGCVKSSTMECDAIITTFMECLQYISFNVLENPKEGPAFLEKVMCDHVVPLVETSFYDNKYIHISTSKFYPLLGSLIQKLEYKCLNETEELSKTFAQTLNLFWNNIYNVFSKLFYKKQGERKRVSVYVLYFFHSTFQSSPSVTKSEKNKVRFEDDSEPDDAAQIPSGNPPSEEMYSKMPLSYGNIIKFIKALCTKTDEEIDLCYLKILDEILASTLNPQFLEDILSSYGATDASEKTSLVFFNRTVPKWISSTELDRSICSCIADIVFSMCASASEGDALEMLNICCKAQNPVFLDCMLIKGLGVYVHEAVIQNWLKSSVLVQSILDGLKEMMEALTTENVIEKNKLDVLEHKNVMFTCLVSKDLQETLEKNESIEKILLICNEFIEKGLNLKSKNKDGVISVSCNIIEMVLLHCKVCWNYKVTDELLCLLFHWNLNADKYQLSDKACSELSKVWRTAVFSSLKSSSEVTKNDCFILKAAMELSASLNNLLSSKQASKTLTQILNLLHCVEEAHSSLPSSHSSAFVLYELLKNALPSESDWDKLKENLVWSLVPSFIERKIFYPLPEENNVTVPHEDILKLFMAAKVVSQVFTKLIERNKISENEQLETCSGDDEHSICKYELDGIYSHCENEQYFDQYLMEHIPSFIWCLSYCNGNGFMNEETKLDVKILEDQCMKILRSLSCEKLDFLLRENFNRSLSKGMYWALPFQTFIEMTEKLHPDCFKSLFFNLTLESYMTESEHGSLVVQILSHHISNTKKACYLNSLLSVLVDKNNFTVVNDDFLSKLAEICCYIQHVHEFDEEEILLSSIFSMDLPCDSKKNTDLLFSLQMTSLFSSINERPQGKKSLSLVKKESWDYFQILLASGIESMKRKSLKYSKPEELLLLSHVSSLYVASVCFSGMHEFMKSTWLPSVAGKINEEFILLFIQIGGVIQKFKPLSGAFENVALNLLKAVEKIPKDILFKNILQSGAVTEKASKSVANKKTSPLDCLLSILLSDIHHLQFAAHLMLMKVMPLLSESLSNAPKNESDDDEEETIPSKLLPLVDVLTVLQELMESMLCDIKIGDCSLVLPDTEPYAFVSAYIYAWLQMLEFISSSPSQVRSGYIAHLEETKLLSSLFSNLYRLMPEYPVSCFRKRKNSRNLTDPLNFILMGPPDIDSDGPTPEKIQLIACYAFATAMRTVPASVRTWWNNLDKNSADTVNKFTSKYISGVLCAAEIDSVQTNENLFKNMMVKARQGSREVIAIYTVDDYTIELSIQLPANYPLGPIIAEKRGKIVLQQQEWRHWLMQLTTVLNYQNGSILDGLSIWKKNLDKKFEGVEECMICYYILHSSTLKLPKLSCHVCRKKFHSACLYKWFHSSNNFTCPLCRNEFVI